MCGVAIEYSEPCFRDRVSRSPASVVCLSCCRQRGRPGQSCFEYSRDSDDRGAEGERRFAAFMADALFGRCVWLLHDRQLTGFKSNVDHVAVSRGGVWVIDTKNWAAAKSDEACRQDWVSEADELIRNAIEPIRDLASKAGFELGPHQVRGLICFIEAGSRPGGEDFDELGQVRTGTLEQATTWISSGAALKPTEIDSLAIALDGGLNAAS